MKPVNPLNPKDFNIVLVLQGGGALGAYQGGVYQALHESELIPDWTVGTSIGAINGALIAGNRPQHRLERLRSFWERIAHPDCYNMAQVPDSTRRSNIWLNTLDSFTRGVPGFFAPRMMSGFALGMTVPPEQASFYDTDPLKASLQELVDFDYLNSPQGMRLTVNALAVKTGQLSHFDSKSGKLQVDHVRASGALPPGFPPVRIDGELYWDGGLYSNTPLESVLQDMPPGDILCFVVDLWQAEGAEPVTYEEVQTRQKDVTFASRTQRHIEDYLNTHRLQRKLRELYARLPAAERTAEDEAELAKLGCDATMHIVRLPYSGKDWHMAAKDVNFSRGSIEWRWQLGYSDAQRAIEQAAWLLQADSEEAIIIHELPPVQRQWRASR